MKFFLRTKKFKICAAALCIIIAVSITARVISGVFSPGGSVLGVIITPFQQLFGGIADGISDIKRGFTDGNKLILENKQLEEKLADYNQLVAENERLNNENKFYEEYLDMKDANPDYKFCSAKVIAKDKSDIYKGFTLNKGTINGVKAKDPVIVGNYLLGYVDTVSLTSCKVVTFLNPKMVFGANDSRTDDPGIVGGTADLAAQNKAKLYNLSRDCTVAVGDYIVTSGEGVFPAGLLVGTVDNIKNDSVTFSTFATITPFAEFDTLKRVMIITDFSSRGVFSDVQQ